MASHGEAKVAQTQPTKKRPLPTPPNLQDSNYYKMRAILRDLRPHFIQVLRTPDFRNCKAAIEIQEKLKLMMNLYEELTAETHEGAKSDRGSMKPPENKPVVSGQISDNQQMEEGKFPGTYVVGGSAFGWNYITYAGSEAVYYGRTKEAFRLQNPVSK